MTRFREARLHKTARIVRCAQLLGTWMLFALPKEIGANLSMISARFLDSVFIEPLARKLHPFFGFCSRSFLMFPPRLFPGSNAKKLLMYWDRFIESVAHWRLLNKVTAPALPGVCPKAAQHVLRPFPHPCRPTRDTDFKGRLADRHLGNGT